MLMKNDDLYEMPTISTNKPIILLELWKRNEPPPFRKRKDLEVLRALRIGSFDALSGLADPTSVGVELLRVHPRTMLSYRSTNFCIGLLS